VRLEKDGRALVIDPGIWAEQDALADVAPVLVTHEHPDHLDEERLRAALAADPAVTVWTNADVAAKLADVGDQVRPVRAGDQVDVAGFDVRVLGERHAFVFGQQPDIANVGFLVDGAVFHPGDSFTRPDRAVAALLVPVSAPWLKLGEAMSYVQEVRPARMFQIHDGVLNERGLGLVDRVLDQAWGGSYQRLALGDSVDIG
jgi:L-ascorbate metabolism protein UlaG (beta-lactamase superfamily)